MIPLMILSDSPLGPSGLGRITRELAQRMTTIPEIRVAVAGIGGTWSRHLPYPFYPLNHIQNYQVRELAQAWWDFAGDEPGILLTIWNHTWLYWMRKPELVRDPDLKDWVTRRPFEHWAYIPIDSTQRDGGQPQKEVFSEIDRVLAYTKFGADSIGCVEHLPHGIDETVFRPIDQKQARQLFGLDQGKFIVGTVATNVERKDWPLAFATLKELRNRGVDAALWGHTDSLTKYWNLPELARIYGMDDHVTITTCHYHNEAMPFIYNACNVTLGIGNEGWGLPLAESLACGVPVVTGDYAGQTEFVPRYLRDEPDFFVEQGPYSLLRPIYKAEDFAQIALSVKGCGDSLLESQFYWKNVWPQWENWVREGLK